MALVLLSTSTQDPTSTHFLHFSSPSSDQETNLVSVFPSVSAYVSSLYSTPNSSAPQHCTMHLPATEARSLPIPRAASSSTATHNCCQQVLFMTLALEIHNFHSQKYWTSSRFLYCLAKICSTCCYSRYLLCTQECCFPCAAFMFI